MIEPIGYAWFGGVFVALQHHSKACTLTEHQVALPLTHTSFKKNAPYA